MASPVPVQPAIREMYVLDTLVTNVPLGDILQNRRALPKHILNTLFLLELRKRGRFPVIDSAALHSLHHRLLSECEGLPSKKSIWRLPNNAFLVNIGGTKQGKYQLNLERSAKKHSIELRSPPAYTPSKLQNSLNRLQLQFRLQGMFAAPKIDIKCAHSQSHQWNLPILIQFGS